MTTNKNDVATNEAEATNENVAVNEAITEVEELAGKKLIVKRKKSDYLTKKGAVCYNYCIEGVLRNRKVRVDLDPADTGGYEVLDITFDTVDELPLTVINNTIKQDGKKNTITTYEVRSSDPSGVTFTATVKPAQKSDKDLLAALLTSINL